jgi:hypothetical protein
VLLSFICSSDSRIIVYSYTGKRATLQVFARSVSCIIQKRKGLEDRALEQNQGFGVGVGSVAEGGGIAVGTQAAEGQGSRGIVDGEALGAAGDFAVLSNPDVGALAPDKGPPRAAWNRTQAGAVFDAGLLTRGVWILCRTMGFVAITWPAIAAGCCHGSSRTR